MKKNYFFTLLLTVSMVFTSFGQEMLLNGGLENWDNSTTPSDWSKAEVLTQESTEVHGGSFSAVRNGGSGTKDFGQTIDEIVPGDSYTISFWYKVTAGDGTDARIWSTWKSAGTTVYHAAVEAEDLLRGPQNGYLDNNGGAWTKHEVTVTAPEGVDAFYFEVRSYSNSTTYWDDLSFVHNETASISKNSIEGFATYPNPVLNGKVTVTSASLSEKRVNIFNLLGKQVLSETFTGKSKLLNVASLSTGIYILKVAEGTKVSTKKLVVR